MNVDASSTGAAPFSTAPDKGPLHLAIVVMLVLLALLTYSLRAYINGKLPRLSDIDDIFMLIAMVCIVGTLITFVGAVEVGLGKLSDHQMFVDIAPWMFSLDVMRIAGLGCAKISAAFYVLGVFGFGYYPCSIQLSIYLQVVLVPVWMTARPIRCMLAGGRTGDALFNEKHGCWPEGVAQKVELSFHSINAASTTFLVLLAVPVVLGRAITLPRWLSTLIAIIFGTVASTASIIRTTRVSGSWPNTSTPSHDTITFTTLGIVELATLTIAINIPALLPLLKHRPRISNPMPMPHPRAMSLSSCRSNQTVIYRPNTAYFPPERFYDEESNLEFDMETPSIHSKHRMEEERKERNDSPSSRTSHTRTVSDWSQFSGFTYYTDGTSDEEDQRDGKEKKMGRKRVSTLELEEIVRELGVRGEAAREEGQEGGREEDRDAVVCLQSEADSGEITVSRTRV
ncbi:hypothetical protein BDW02DRAFT_598035 [Decorospora gaudefroyi]|uniref:Rhodopsin domain-containing protein n=1 Tax=Decorospora gaudefroyi TaxID=184978 RepID=A0A6A5KG72_9PLEO|nr:hypothetical protein BDW02DRAFT_598035 [Decorospora gaudefroyi]